MLATGETGFCGGGEDVFLGVVGGDRRDVSGSCGTARIVSRSMEFESTVIGEWMSAGVAAIEESVFMFSSDATVAGRTIQSATGSHDAMRRHACTYR